MRWRNRICCSLIIGLTICLLFNSVGQSARPARFDQNLITDIGRVNDAIYNEQFGRAEKLIDSLIPQSDSLPFRHLYKAILAQTKMMTAESDSYEAELFLALDSVEHYSQQILSSGGDSACAYYFLGQAFAFRSLYNGRAGHLWSAIKTGRKAGEAFTDGYKIDTTFYDISLGLGSYWYWKSAKTKLINWTPLFKNEKQKGISHLRRAANYSELSQDAARSALIWVYINEGRYKDAIEMASSLFQMYPKGLTFLWGLAQAHYEMGSYKTAEFYYLKIWNRLLDDPGNYYNIIEVAWNLLNCRDELVKIKGNIDVQVEEISQFIRESDIPKQVKKRQKEKLKEILKN